MHGKLATTNLRMYGLLLVILCSIECRGFVSSSPTATDKKIQDTIGIDIVDTRYESRCVDTSLNGLFGKKEEEVSPQSDLSVPTRVLEIPVLSIKQGGMRFALGLHMISLQDKGTWRANEASTTKLDMFFKDNSAMFQLVLDNDKIYIDRYGQPSLAYVLQESLVLHSILDEINKLAYEVDDIEAENRLIQFDDPDVIEKTRSSLPARKA